MKSALVIAALFFGGTAIAQTQPSGETVSDPSLSTGPRGVTQQNTDPEGQACAPAGFNQGASSYPTCAGTPAASSTTPPRCSRTVTDNCIQAYERGVRRPG